MTSDDFDRIARAWLEAMPAEAPDRVIDSVRHAVERTPQARPSRAIGRWRLPDMNRSLFVAIAAAVVLLVGGLAAVQLRGTAPQGGPTATAAIGVASPSSSPTPRATPPATPTTTAPTASPLGSGPTPGITAVPMPEALHGKWVAGVGQVDGLVDHDPGVRLLVNGDGSFSLQTNVYGNTTLHGVPTAATGDQVTLVTDRDGSTCVKGDVGRYGWSVSADGSELTLTAVSDDCATRAKTLARTWLRVADAGSAGGRGALAVFDPAVVLTLPSGMWLADTWIDAIALHDGSTDVVVAKDPWGVTEPCAPGSGQPKPIKQGTDAFVAHLKTLPGVTVKTKALTIDGHPAVHVTLSSDASTACASGSIVEYGVKSVTSGAKFGLTPGDADNLYVVALPSSTYVIGVTGTGLTPAQEQALISSVRFQPLAAP
jgi:hypothetical protein